MAKTETPEKVVDFSKLDGPAKLEVFKEALKGDDLKDTNLIKELDIKLPEPKAPEKISKNEEEIKRLLDVHEKTRDQLLELGHKFEEKKTKMSEAETIIYDKIEKNSQANLSEAIDALVKIDPDSPHEIVSKMSIPTEEKVIVAKAFKEMATRNQEAVKKIKDELDTAASELKDAKLSAPKKEEDKTGKDIVDQALSKMGEPAYKDPEAEAKVKAEAEAKSKNKQE